MSDREEPAARLHILFATDAPIAVILRIGPHRCTQMLLWQTDTDRFIPGQWFKQAIYPHACHLHPSGKYIFLSLGDYRRRGGKWWERPLRSYQTVSRPPYFTALAFLPMSETSRYKGRIEPGCPYIVDSWIQELTHIRGDAPTDWTVINTYSPGFWGWIKSLFMPHSKTYTEKCSKEVIAGDGFELIRRSWGGSPRVRDDWDYFVSKDNRETPLDRGAGYHVDRRGRLITWRDGKVYYGNWKDESYSEILLIDFNDQVFEEVQAPDWAKTWTESE